MILYLKEIMSAKGISSVALAEKLGVTKATISYWINGKVFPNPDEKLKPLAEALGVELWQLFISPEEASKLVTKPSPNGIVTCPVCGSILSIDLKPQKD